MPGLVFWLSCYVYSFAVGTYLTTINQCLTNFFFKTLYVIRKTSVEQCEKKT